MRTYQFGVKGQGKTKLKEFTIEDTNPPANSIIKKHNKSSHMFGPLPDTSKPEYIKLAIVAITIGLDGSLKQQAFQEVSKPSMATTSRKKDGIVHKWHSLSYPLLNPSVKKPILQFFKPGIKNNNISSVNVWIVGSSLPTRKSPGHVIYMFSNRYLFETDTPPSKNTLTDTQKQKAKETLRKYSLLMDGSKIIQLFQININEPKSVSVGSIVLHTIIGKNQWNQTNHTVDPGFRNRIQQLHNTLTNKKRKSTVQSTDPAKKQKTTSLFDRVFIGAKEYMPEEIYNDVNKKKRHLYVFYPQDESRLVDIRTYVQGLIRSNQEYEIRLIPYETTEKGQIYVYSAKLGLSKAKSWPVDLVVSPYINANNTRKKPVIRITNVPHEK